MRETAELTDPLIDRLWKVALALTSEELEQIKLSREELHPQMVLGKALRTSPVYAIINKIILEQFKNSVK